MVGEKSHALAEGDSTSETTVRFVHRLLIRMTREERRLLGRKAHAAEMSLSRFLIQSAMRGKTPPTQAERAELESLMFLLRRAANILNRLLANTRAMRLVGADAEIENELKNARELLVRLLAELRRRQ